MKWHNIKNHFGTIIDQIEAETPEAAVRIYKTKHDLTQAQIERAGYTVEEEPILKTPKNGEVWETKSGSTVLIVDRPTEEGLEKGFVWFDPIDKEICYTLLMDQLSHRINISITEWGMMMQAWMPPPTQI